MERQTVHWKQPGTAIKADPGATVGLDKAQWEALGAVFEFVDDGDGETPGLAVLEIVDGGVAISAAVLDYGAAQTFLLVPGATGDQRRNVDVVVKSLVDNGLLREQDVLDRVPHDPEGRSDGSAAQPGTDDLALPRLTIVGTKMRVVKETRGPEKQPYRKLRATHPDSSRAVREAARKDQ